ncbi:DMT family transporter [Limisphaera ngatamarikiensis]|uniref:DMT family transporter n=1 Tax=Limisphaera ngatamarikiensis TaxID=1324935 RepID=A0A6M1RR61_9BACT|nr:DMT family transporter [Limisphaera ngatamarikiensis]NGO39867.1 DMT family transporter [Limisphaera ngatamarikiensis]
MKTVDAHSLRLSLGLLLAVFLWGGNNAGVRFLVQHWPPVFTGSTRFLLAGLLLWAVLRRTRWLGPWEPVPRTLNAPLWWRGGFSLAAYIVVFNEALRHTSASHVALLLAASPVWALVWEGRRPSPGQAARSYAAAALALAGVAVLVAPQLGQTDWSWTGELLGLLASVLWTNYGRQCRWLGQHLQGAEVTAHSMWRAAVWLSPWALAEVCTRPVPLRPDLVGVQLYCVLAGGVAAFGLWTHALRHWETSRVLLFNNLIPLTTMLWAAWFLGEPVTLRFFVALALVLSGVWLGRQPRPAIETGAEDPNQGPRPIRGP